MTVHGTPTSRKSVLYSRSTGGTGLRDASCLIQTPRERGGLSLQQQQSPALYLVVSSYRRIVVVPARRNPS